MIGILLPYKENFSPEYPGAVSLFVYETSKISKYKKRLLFLETQIIIKNLILGMKILLLKTNYL